MIGETLGSYTIVSRLGAGGMGEVYLAQHTRIDRRAAIKVLLPGLSSDQEILDRFFSEARATSSIHHHGIVEVLDCDVHRSGRAYIVMELLEGSSLAGRLASERTFGRDLPRVFHVAACIADAVAAAHAKGIVHRDLKPDNVFLATDAAAPFGFETKILDFGIAKLMGTDADGGRPVSARTRTGSLMGTPAYMSPEQCRGASRVDHRTDIYSLGCIVYEMLAGRLPFTYQGFGELIAAHIHEPPPTLASVGVDVPAGAEAFVQRLLAKAPEARFQTLRDVVTTIHALEPALKTTLPRSPSDGPAPFPTTAAIAATTFSSVASERVDGRERGRGKLVALAGGIVVVGGAAVALVLAGHHGASSLPTVPPAPAVVAPPPVAPVVMVTVSDAPRGLTVLVDGQPGALPLRWPAGTDIHELTFRAPGFTDRVMRLDASSNRLLTLAMQPTPVAPPAVQTEPHKHRPRSSHAGDLNDDARKL